MIHFIRNHGTNESVETVMGYVNDYVNKGNVNHIAEGSQYYTIHQEFQKLLDLENHIEMAYPLSVDRPIRAQGRFSRLKIFVKKAIRKCIKWYMTDMSLQQMDFNAHVSWWIAQSMNVIREMDAEINRLNIENLRYKKAMSILPDEWYVEFEDQFRGEQSVIRERLMHYVEIFKDKKKVIDLGCGRGEFLELMTEKGVSAYGVDMNQKMVQECRKKGLDVEQKDCIAALNELEDNSLDGIFASQLVEHLSKEELYRLVNLSYDKLSHDGVLVFETVNPLTLGVFCYGFYIDPTHTVPVHPAMLRFMAEKAGFYVEPVGFLNEFPPEYKFKESDNMIQEEKDVVQKLNEQLYGAQDYYLVCRKR